MTTPISTIILIPVFNDWAAAALLIGQIDAVLTENSLCARVLFVDDGSSEPPEPALSGIELKSITAIEVLALKRNLGHQRAIAIGLAFVADNIECDSLIVMDGDGEDAPADIPRLLAGLEEEGGGCIVFAERARRAEGIVFRLCYQAYKLLHLLLTGVAVRVGNFSAVPGAMLTKLVVLSELWNHYSAAVFVARLPFRTVITARARRLDGKTKMNFQDLVIHGLRALSVYGEAITVRLLILSAVVIFSLVAVAAGVFLVDLFATASLVAEVSPIVWMFFLLLVHGFVVTALCGFIMIGRRSYSHFLPSRDYSYFVDACRRVGGPADGPASGG